MASLRMIVFGSAGFSSVCRFLTTCQYQRLVFVYYSYESVSQILKKSQLNKLHLSLSTCVFVSIWII